MGTAETQRGLVTNIQRFSVHDGPGIRTIVFLKGCPLRCRWCQNPENLRATVQITFDAESCIHCGRCLYACPNNAIRIEGNALKTNFAVCTSCFTCCDACPSHARNISGKHYSADELLAIVVRDRVFYNNSGGGVTLSGGDPVAQPAFATALLEKLQADGIHTTIETCGYCDSKTMAALARYCDLILFDIKHSDPEKHRLFTGVSNERILNNLSAVARTNRVVVRLPLIPGVNDDSETLCAIADICVENRISSLHILPFHQFGLSKWLSLDFDYTLGELSAMTPEEIKKCASVITTHSPELTVCIGGNSNY